MGWLDRLRPACAILTHLSTFADYDAVQEKLPPYAHVAYDGLRIEINESPGNPPKIFLHAPPLEHT